MKLKGTLEDKCINRFVSEAGTVLLKNGISENDRLRFKLSLEELLLSFRDVFGMKTKISLNSLKKAGKLQVTVNLPGDCHDPISETDSLILIKVLHDWSSAPAWSYINGVNIVTYSFAVRKSLVDNLSFAWKYTAPNKKYLFLAVDLQFISVILMIIAPILSARIIVAFTDSAFSRLIYMAIALFAVNYISRAVLLACNMAYNVVYSRTLSALEADISDNVLKITDSCMDEKGTGLFIQRLTSDTSNLATVFNTLADNLSQVCQYVGILCAMLIVSPRIFGLCLSHSYLFCS